MSQPRFCFLLLLFSIFLGDQASGELPPFTDYCTRLRQEIQGKKHGFLAGNLSYYVGGFHASWDLKEHETIGLTHPFKHDLRSRGVGIIQSTGVGKDDTGLGNDFSGWEFYKDTKVLYGSVLIGDQLFRHPVPAKMYWQPDRMICEYEISGVQIREEKFIAKNDAVCTIIESSKPVTLLFEGQSFFGRHSVSSSATARYDDDSDVIHVLEGGMTQCQPETDRSKKIAPIMYDGMSTVLTATREFASTCEFSENDQGQQFYQFQVPCDPDGVALIWAMGDKYREVVKAIQSLRDSTTSKTGLNRTDTREAIQRQNTPVQAALAQKSEHVNLELNAQIPRFGCSDKRHEDIYYFLWSLYLMYYIDVGRGMEMEPHTQTAVNNFLGMHRYDAAFQIKVGSWITDQSTYSYGNVLTWKNLFKAGYYKKSPQGVIALADNKGVSWHSGVYGNELSEHVLGAWQIYQHTDDLKFLRDCYEGYFREIFYRRIAPFASNHFEVAETLANMAQLTGHPEDIAHWNQLIDRSPDAIEAWFEQRWQVNGHRNYFAGSPDGMLMTNGFWHIRSRFFPNEYAIKMVDSWADDRVKGFHGKFFPLAMSRRSMQRFASDVDHAFGYTPDTAYFTLSGMFRQRLGDVSQRLALNHLEHYNFNAQWGIPVAPEAYTRDGVLFGDQYSNFNAGKILLYLEGFAGIDYSLPDNELRVHENMPKEWQWMEFQIPMVHKENDAKSWVNIRYERDQQGDTTQKKIVVSDCPLNVVIEPWTEAKEVRWSKTSHESTVESESSYPDYGRYEFRDSNRVKSVELQLWSDQSSE